MKQTKLFRDKMHEFAFDMALCNTYLFTAFFGLTLLDGVRKTMG